jgi:hypothetical protein
LPACQVVELEQSSVGCEFRANKMQNFIEEPSSLVVGNVSEDDTANVQLYYWNGNAEQAVGNAVAIMPGDSHEYVLGNPVQPGDVSVLRDGGTYHVVSDVPVVAYQHSPISAQAHNDSSMLLPDHAQGQNFIVAAWGTNIGSDRSYFDAIALEDDTQITWEPPDATLAGTGVPAVAGGAQGAVMLDEGDMLQVVTNGDISGTIVTSDKPIWLVGAVPCVNIPANVTFCDHIEEQMLPLDYWGEEYVGAHAPTRGNEDYWWRVYAGDDAVTIDTAPPQNGFPVVLDRGEFFEFSTTQSFMFTGDGPFLPVQYLEGQNGGAGTGDPASFLIVPTEQFLDRYVFVTGSGYTEDYVQVVRENGAADVTVDGMVVNGYYAVGGFEVADWVIPSGSHLAESQDEFAIVQVGYTNVTSYAYPGGLKLAVINPQ